MGKLKFSFFAAAAMCTLSANAVTLPDIVGDGMVLQQNADARLWGWSSVGADVKVTTSWNGASYDTRADEKGRWSVAIATPPGPGAIGVLRLSGPGAVRLAEQCFRPLGHIFSMRRAAQG